MRPIKGPYTTPWKSPKNGAHHKMVGGSPQTPPPGMAFSLPPNRHPQGWRFPFPQTAIPRDGVSTPSLDSASTKELLVLVWFEFGFSLVLVRFQFGVSYVLVLFQFCVSFCVSFVLASFYIGFSSVLVWFQFGVSLVLVLVQSGFCLVLVWFQCGFIVVLVWV